MTDQKDLPPPHKLTVVDLRRMNLPEEFWRANLAQAHPTAQKYVRNYWSSGERLESNGVGLLLEGGEGVGKTALASILLKKARCDFKSCYFTRLGELRDNLRSEAMFDADQTVLARLQEVDVLVLDGLNAAYFTGWPFNLADAVDLIASRGSRMKVTHVTTSSWRALMDARAKIPDELGRYLVPLKVEGENRRTKALSALSKIIKGEG